MGAHETLSRSRATGATGAPGVGPILAARGVSVCPPGTEHPAVRDIALEVRPGEWIALVGENGGGKSSLLHALAGLWPVSSGTVALEGRPFGPAQPDRGAGTVVAILQDPSSQILQPTVAEELAFTARNLGMPEEEIAREVSRWARALDLEGDLQMNPASLSAGRQQRVLLAAALVPRPRVLLADEPTAHLDEPGRSVVRTLIRELVEGGMAAVWATQDPREIASATRTLELRRPGTGVPHAMPHRAPGAESGGAGAEADRPVLRVTIAGPAPQRGPRVAVSRRMEFTIAGSGLTGLVGPNGAGKSVLLLALAGLEQPEQVAVKWNRTPDVPPIVALQYPELQVFEDLVADELAFAAVSRGMARTCALDRAAGCLRELGFDPDLVLGRRTWTLSTGEKRLIEVVGALIAPAGLLLLDEPTAGLDSRRRAALGSLVERRASAGPVVVASQDLEWVEGLRGVRVELGG